MTYNETFICPKCDVEFKGNSCPACGWQRFVRLKLVGMESGKTTSFGITTSVGQTMIRDLCGEDARFANNNIQFTIERQDDYRSWCICPGVKLQYPTFLNGTPITGKTQLKNGDILSIGSAKARMVVYFDDK